MDEQKVQKRLEEIFVEIESVREEASHQPSIDSLLKEEGGHVYSDGLFESLDEDFSSTSNDYPGMSMFR